MPVLDRELKPLQVAVERDGEFVRLIWRLGSEYDAILSYDKILDELNAGRVSIEFTTEQASE